MKECNKFLDVFEYFVFLFHLNKEYVMQINVDH
jgi:hypothetical protein